MPPSQTSTQRTDTAQTSTKPARRRGLLFRLAAVLLGFLVVLVVVEVGLRLSGYAPVSLRNIWRLNPLDETRQQRGDYYSLYEENPHGDFEPLPELDGDRWELLGGDGAPRPLERIDERPWCVEYRHSSLGLRERELDGYWPPPGTTRIACVGDSFAYGQGVPAAKTLPRTLEAELGNGAEVVSISRVGWDLSEETKQLARFRQEHHCGKAIFVFVLNDLLLTKELALRNEAIFQRMHDREESLERFRSGLWQLGPSRLCQLISASLADHRVSQETLAWYRDCFDPAKNDVGLDLLEQQLAELASLKDCRVAIVIFPIMRQLDDDYPFLAAHERVAEMATAAGLPVLDLLPEFRGQDARSLWVNAVDNHPNSRGHAIAAKAIARWLREALPEFLEPDERH
ncbi:MAG: SGNH/GDSL hydrolase family protein [Planctomycetota bacterium]|nr:MAG: SGNH/GDSL hydrolase family protein [Planctomycetota bacterium]